MKRNAEYRTFFVFVIVAVVFWFLQTFKENSNTLVSYDIIITNASDDIVFLDEMPKLGVSVTGRGFNLIEYLTRLDKRKIELDIALFSNNGSSLTMDNSTLSALISKRLPSGVILTSLFPEALELYYSEGEKKAVAITLDSKISTGKDFVVSDIKINPQYIDIYASAAIFDTITTICSQPITLSNLTDTISLRSALCPIKGVKCMQDSIDVTICVDLITTGKMRLPIYTLNIPDNLLLRTFPQTAEISFRVSSTLYPTLSDTDFILAVDYASITSSQNKARLELIAQPEGIKDIQIQPSWIEYIIEACESE